MSRRREVAHQLLVSVDQFAQTAIVGTGYLLRLTDHCPSADETISSYVGRAQLRGRPWARPVAAVIDQLFVWTGEAPGHCIRNIETPCAIAPAS